MTYIESRNKLIPLAEIYADRLHGFTYKPGSNPEEKADYRKKWGRCFLDRMNQLCKENGI